MNLGEACRDKLLGRERESENKKESLHTLTDVAEQLSVCVVSLSECKDESIRGMHARQSVPCMVKKCHTLTRVAVLARTHTCRIEPIFIKTNS